MNAFSTAWLQMRRSSWPHVRPLAIFGVVVAVLSTVAATLLASQVREAEQSINATGAFDIVVVDTADPRNTRILDADAFDEIASIPHVREVIPRNQAGLMTTQDSPLAPEMPAILWATPEIAGAHPEWIAGEGPLERGEIALPSTISGIETTPLLGQEIPFTYQRRTSPDAVEGMEIELKVRAIFDANVANNDGNSVAYVNWEDVKEWAAQNDGIPVESRPDSAFAVIVGDGGADAGVEANSAEVQKELQQRGFGAVSNSHLAASIEPATQFLGAFGSITRAASALLFLLIGAMIGSAIAQKRQRFFGVAKSFGMTSARLLLQVFLETLMLGLLLSAATFAAGTLLSAAIVQLLGGKEVGAFTIPTEFALTADGWWLYLLIALAMPAVAVLTASRAVTPLTQRGHSAQRGRFRRRP